MTEPQCPAQLGGCRCDRPALHDGYHARLWEDGDAPDPTPEPTPPAPEPPASADLAQIIAAGLEALAHPKPEPPWPEPTREPEFRLVDGELQRDGVAVEFDAAWAEPQRQAEPHLDPARPPTIGQRVVKRTGLSLGEDS